MVASAALARMMPGMASATPVAAEPNRKRRRPKCHLVMKRPPQYAPLSHGQRPTLLPPAGKHGAGGAPRRDGSAEAHHDHEPEHGHDRGTPKRQRRRREPAEMNPGAAQETDEQPVAARRSHRQEAAPLDRRPSQLQPGH